MGFRPSRFQNLGGSIPPQPPYGSCLRCLQDSSVIENIPIILTRASDISREKKQNFAGFSGANSWKNWPISRDFRGKKVKIRSKIGPVRVIFVGEKSKFTEKLADFAGF